jgi:hypothetical protein
MFEDAERRCPGVCSNPVFEPGEVEWFTILRSVPHIPESSKVRVIHKGNSISFDE